MTQKQIIIAAALIFSGCTTKSGVVQEKIFTPGQTSAIVTYSPQTGQPNFGVAASDDTYTLLFDNEAVSVTRNVFFAVSVGDSITLKVGKVDIHKRKK